MARMGLIRCPKNTASAAVAAANTTITASESVLRNGGGGRGAPCCSLMTRLARKVRKQGRMLCGAAATALQCLQTQSTSATFRCRYDPLSYALNFDDSYEFHHAFSSRFITSSSPSPSPSH